MKNLTILTVLLCTGLLSCTKEELPTPVKKANVSYVNKSESVVDSNDVINHLSGNYKILSFNQGYYDHSHKFQNATLSLLKNGDLKLYNHNNIKSGSWHYDHARRSVTFSITGNELADLLNNEGWVSDNSMQAQSANSLLLQVKTDIIEKYIHLRKNTLEKESSLSDI